MNETIWVFLPIAVVIGIIAFSLLLWYAAGMPGLDQLLYED